MSVFLNGMLSLPNFSDRRLPTPQRWELNVSGTSWSSIRVPVRLSARLIKLDEVSTGEPTELSACQNLRGSFFVYFQLVFNESFPGQFNTEITTISGLTRVDPITLSAGFLG